MNYLDFYPSILQENRKVAKELVVQGKLSPEEFEQLQSIDPSQTKKYMGWMAKQWVTKSVTDIDELRNKIEEYDAFVKNGKAKTKDIYQFASFADLKKEVDELNAMGSESKSELRDDYEIIMDELRDYRFFKNDMLHPNDLAIDYVWEKFTETYFSAKTNGTIGEVEKLNRMLAHRVMGDNALEIEKFEALLEKQKEKVNLLLA